MSDVTGSQPTEGSPDPDSDAGIAGTVTDEWVEVYPPDGAAPEPEPEPERFRLPRVPTILFAVAALCTLFGSLLPLGVASQGPIEDAGASTIAIDAWRLTDSSAVEGHTLTHVMQSPIPIGYPIAVAVVLALIVVVLRLRGARGALVVGVVTATYAVTLVFLLGMLEIAWSVLFVQTGPPSPAPGVQTSIGAGFWALVLAAAVATVGAALAFRTPAAGADKATAEPVADTWPAEPETPEPETPDGQPEQWPVVAVIPPDEGTNW